MIITIERFAGLIACRSLNEWRDLVFKIGDDLGYERTLLAILPDPKAPIEAEQAFLHSNYTAAWRNKYDSEKLHLIDPTFSHCVKKSTPLIWTPEIFNGKRQKEMYEEASGYGIRSGITLPIHGPHGEMGILCFVNDVKPGKKFLTEASHNLPALSHLRDIIFETSLDFIRPASEPAPRISAKELECIKWCAIGKSSWDISQILCCSEAAINYHFGNLRRKFRVSSRQQVVVKALRYGLI